VEHRIRPEPTAEERAAILAALDTLVAEEGAPAFYGSAWREAGIRENLSDLAETEPARPERDEGSAQGATARPRSSQGATRA
jgi:hypothetical protein